MAEMFETSGHTTPWEPFADFDYAAIDRQLGLHDEMIEPEATKTLMGMLTRLVKVIDRGRTVKGRDIRWQAFKYLLKRQDQPGLAKEIGVTKAALSKVARQIAEELGVQDPRMRSEQTCQQFSEQTAQRHAIRKMAQLNPKLIQ
jgi:hypothetical protein